MMIDFALEAERHEGKSPQEAIYQACLLRFRPIMMTTMAALFGALPLALGTRHGFGVAPAARHRHRRRPDRQPDAHPVHDAGRLSLSRPLPAVVRAPPTELARPMAPRSSAGIVIHGLHAENIARRVKHRRFAPALVAAMLLPLSACMVVGPDHVRPPVITPGFQRASDGWRVAQPKDGPDPRRLVGNLQ